MKQKAPAIAGAFFCWYTDMESAKVLGPDLTALSLLGSIGEAFYFLGKDLRQGMFRMCL